jgi:hypothetical protein
MDGLAMTKYMIVRFYMSGEPEKVIRKNVSLAEAQAHCNNPETTSTTATCARSAKITAAHGEWFDGYREM